jgi:hypothetical protein
MAAIPSFPALFGTDRLGLIALAILTISAGWLPITRDVGDPGDLVAYTAC